MSASRLRLLGLVAAVLAVLAALWVLYGGDRSSAGRRGAERAGGGEGSSAAEPEADSRGRGVGAREITIAGDGVVQGEVLDEDGQAVVEGQLVLWCLTPDGEVARIRDGVLGLDEEGRFSGPACRGMVCPELRHPSRIPAEPWSLRPGTEATLHTRVLPRLWGRVVDPQGQPVAGAQVVVTRGDEEDPGATLPVVSPRTSTDADGELSLALIERPPCDPCQQARDACPGDEPLPVIDRVRVSARASGWAPGAIEVDVLEQQGSEEPFELVLQAPRAAISGSLLDAAGEPAPRAIVLARSESQPQEQHRAEAGEGIFSFDALAEGPYTLRAIQDGRELLRREGVQPGETLELRLPHAQRELTLQLVDEQGRPRPEVEVRGGPFERQRSDAGGLVYASGVLPGSYILRLRPPGERARAHDLEVPDAAGTAASAPMRVVVAGSAPR